MKKCVVCGSGLVGKQKLYCGNTCKQSAYWRRRHGVSERMSLDELIEVTNWYLTNDNATITQKPNWGEILVLLFGSNKQVNYDSGIFVLEDVK